MGFRHCGPFLGDQNVVGYTRCCCSLEKSKSVKTDLDLEAEEVYMSEKSVILLSSL